MRRRPANVLAFDPNRQRAASTPPREAIPAELADIMAIYRAYPFRFNVLDSIAKKWLAMGR